MRIKKLYKDLHNGACRQSGVAAPPCAPPSPSPSLSSCGAQAQAQTNASSPEQQLLGDLAANNNPHDADFTHDNSYQWFLDYNYRDSSCQHASVLSSLSGSSYKGLGSLALYEELARDLDANLAEADMESFRTRDIHALLSNLPPSACHLMQDGEDSTAGSINTMSICKSELLFSPVKENAMAVPGHFSVDSLDCDRLEQDLILTCQANKHNYTIAFEGSITMESEDNDCHDSTNEKQDFPGEAKYSSSSETHDATTYSTEKLQKSFRLSRPLDSSMAQSDSGFTTWSKLKNRTSQSQLRRHPSGNNNQHASSSGVEGVSSLMKSRSAPDLRPHRNCRCLASSSSAHALVASGQHEESYTAENRLIAPPGCLKALNASHNSHCTNHSIGSQEASEGMTSSGDSRGLNNSRPHNFNLVKLFMKQKSMSNDGIVGSAMDQSSECWPISSEGGDSADSFCIDSKGKEQEHHRSAPPAKMNLSSDRDYQSDDCDIAQPDTKNNTKQWVDNDTNEYSACTFEDSLAEGANNHEAFTKRTHDFIIEEDEISEKSEQDVDKNIYATVNKHPLKRFNVNNNNSFEKVGSNTGSPIRVRGNATTQTKKSLNSSINNSISVSSFSESEATQATRLHRLVPKDLLDHKATSTQLSMDLIDKSMQTSCSSSINISRERNLLRVVEPSFLEKLKKGNNQKPVYVLYPNYTLPDLGFISKDQDMDKFFLKPLKYAANDKGKSSQKQGDKNKRPFSCNDVEGLRKKGFKHIRDWDSLTFLLPMEYRQILSEMPEIVQQLKDKEEDLMRNKERPLFCVSPPVRHKSRPVSCDCASLLSNNATNVSSSSSTATQPSSGYRGSSTMLTDSSAQNSPAPVQGFNPLFVYKYDSATSSEASFMNDKQRSGMMGNAPPLPKRSISLAEQTKMAVNGKVIDVAPPRPPLPKSILRKSIDKVRNKNTPNSKRYSMFEMEDHVQENNVICMNAQTDQKNIKRRSLQEPYYLLKNNSIVEMKKNNDLAAKRFSQQFLDAAEKDVDETEYFHDEGVGTESSLESGKSHARPPTPPLPKDAVEVNPFVFPTTLSQPVITSAELQQLEDFLKHSGITCNNMEDWDRHHLQKVRNQVSKFLSMKQSQEGKESLNSSCSSGHSKKSVSFAEKNDERKGDVSVKPVEELKTGMVTPPNSPNISGVLGHRHYQAKNLAEIPIREEGESSPEGYASPSIGYDLHRAASNNVIYKRELVTSVVDAVDMILEDGTWCPRLVIGALCPSLYALLSDGLRETIDTPFGPANNSVWQVIEASARQGPITKSLNELVMRINSEDALSESVLKFNAFIMGLLNVRSLDAFVSYLRTRESVLRRHYSTTAALRGNSATLLSAALSPLATSPFALDLLWQLKDMRRSFKLMDDLMSNESNSSGEWAGDRGNSGGGKFRRLQRRWEMLSGQESPQRSVERASGSTPGSAGSTPGSAGSTPGSGRSRIPRPVTSPVRSASASNIVSPVKRSIPVSVGSSKKATTPPSGGPANQKAPLPPLPHGHSTAQRTPISNTAAIKKTTTNTTRVSRVESFGVGPSAPRPSSLPYRRVPPPSSSSLSRPRRAASTSQPRPTAPVNATTTKMVRTLWHRLPSDSGHLAFNEGERLRLVLEVDQQWLLCCRGQQKGLVPRDAVMPVPDNALQRF